MYMYACMYVYEYIHAHVYKDFAHNNNNGSLETTKALSTY